MSKTQTCGLAVWLTCVAFCFTTQAETPAAKSPAAKTPDAKSPAAKTPDAKRDTHTNSQHITDVGHPTLMSPHASPIALHGEFVFVVNTPADTVEIIERASRSVVARVNVGVDPVSIAVRPDGREVWVSNHVSDSVSVIDNVVGNPTYRQVIATIQDFSSRTKATRFDEPMGIAFAGNDKAYVALSSENQIAVIDVSTRSITRRLKIPAQDPRAIVVRNDRLYVIPFESNNKTQLSGGTGKLDGDLTTFNAWEHSIANNNVLSLGHVVDIVKHPRVPDRDLFVFDTKTDTLIETVDTLGTLLYGLAVDSKGRVFIAQTDARNAENGRAGTKKHGLKELENRAFLNQVTVVPFAADKPGPADFLNLEPLPPMHPAKDDALATPFAIQVSPDDATLFVTAAGSDKLVSIDADSGEIRDTVQVGGVPRGIVLENSGTSVTNAWVFNAVENSVSVVDAANPNEMTVLNTISLADPTHPVVKRGRIAFNTASASSTGTFSCASCHPDGHTDQLLWVLKTPIVTGGDQIMPRSTMPIRGLRDTAPFHWDGIPGDPYGGNNSANIHGSSEPNSDINDPTSSTRHLIDGGIASTMSMVGDETKNDEGKAGALTAAQRDDMAAFLLSVPYPPAQRRAYTNEVSKRAQTGFKLFHIDGDLDGKVRPNVCGNCHRMPFLVSTNTPGTGMDAPTWRGAYDRFLILPQGRLNIIDFDFYERVAQQGQPERNIWQFSWGGRRRFDPIWEMVLEGSTGFSGSFARQATLSPETAQDDKIQDLLAALEVSASEGAIVLEGDGVFMDKGKAKPARLQFQPDKSGGRYLQNGLLQTSTSYERSELLALASSGKFVGTFTGKHGARDDIEFPQPAIWTIGSIADQRGRQKFPMLYPGRNSMAISGRHIRPDARIFVNGRRAAGSLQLHDNEKIVVELADLPDPGMHLLQIQNTAGMFSNDFIFHVTKDAEAAAEQKRRTDAQHRDVRSALLAAVEANDVSAARKFINQAPRRINEQRPSDGTTALNAAALRGNLEMVKLLIRRGAKVNATNRDGNTPLHAAVFLCQTEVVKYLLEKGASTSKRNHRRESPIDVVSGEWSDGLGRFYTGIGQALHIEIDLDHIKTARKEMAKLLQTTASKGDAKKDENDDANENEKEKVSDR